MERHRALIERHLVRWAEALPQDDLYAPMAYLVLQPAKRVRPALVLLACELFGGRAEDVLDEAVGIELFHNFSLMHDDIMDRAPLRRGLPTVHEKWNANTAILSGDALLVKAYQAMGTNGEVLSLFSRYALEVCEGQQWDMAFEQRTEVSEAEYLRMIRAKTAVLLSCALQIGAMRAGAGVEDRMRIGAFGEHLGLAFQLRDDLLDAFGDPDRTGKQQGGDLRAGKKTLLLIRGLRAEKESGPSVLQEELAKLPAERDVRRMLQALRSVDVEESIAATIRAEEAKAITALDAIAVEDERKAALRALASALMDRTH
ncbi:MAG TPA: polyprenyl synthetase family protein [Flavobacteriales bacterium]